ncbi:MAG: hypothetical protein E7391_05580 [Ruminococcaceae bacterium]|nr:hypothetical protein [Oscillospiraceae bacterium]
MDISCLSQLNYLDKEIRMLTDKINKLNERKSKKGIGFDAECEDEIVYLTDLIKNRRKKCLLDQRRIENFISTISDSQMRMIISLRYINGLSWQQVAFEMGEFDESYPRKKHNKFLKDLQRRVS